jgi:hypothetical protein
MKAIKILALAGAILAMNVPQAVWSAPAARLAWTHKTVQVRSGNAWVGGYRSMPLNSGAYVRTGTDSRAQIQYTDGTVVRLGSRSVARVRYVKNKEVQIAKGKAWFKVAKQKQPMRVRTRTAVATVLGTEFVIDVKESATQQSLLPSISDMASQPLLNVGMDLAQLPPSGPLTIHVLEGLVNMGGNTNLRGGMMLELDANGGILNQGSFNVDQFRQQEGLPQENEDPNQDQGDKLADEPVAPENPTQQIQVRQNGPDNTNLTTSPTTGDLEVVIR